MPLIHFNHSGAGLPSPQTVQAIIDQLRLEAEMGPMEASHLVAEKKAETYELAARLLNCSPQQIAFGTGHGQLFGDIVSAIPLEAADEILVSRQEWMGNIACLQNAANLTGATVKMMASDDTTAVDVDALRSALSADVRIVALTWIGASSTLVNPAAAIGRVLRETGSSAFFIIDASQAIGQIPIDVQELGCDALTACGRKFLRGPRGTGLAYISPRLAAKAVLRKIDNFTVVWDSKNCTSLTGSARAFEIGEESVALRLGLGKAMEQALENGIANIQSELGRKSTRLRHALASVTGVRVMDLGNHKSASVTFTVDGLTCASVKQNLAGQNIAIGMNGREYTPFDLDIRGISELLRASVHLSTTDNEIESLVEAIRQILSEAGIRKT